MTKREFFDAVYLRYGWDINRLPAECVCGVKFSVDHALQCKVGGFIHMRHNDLVTGTTDLVTSICKDVLKEPVLQFKADSDVEWRADLSIRDFW